MHRRDGAHPEGRSAILWPNAYLAHFFFVDRIVLVLPRALKARADRLGTFRARMSQLRGRYGSIGGGLRPELEAGALPLATPNADRDKDGRLLKMYAAVLPASTVGVGWR